MADRIARWALSWPAFFLALGWLGLFSQTDTAARLHGSLLPVVTEMQIESLTETEYLDRPATIVSGSAVKNRECSFRGVEWALEGQAGMDVKVDAFFKDAPMIRGEGVQHWQALIVGVPPDQLPDTRGVVRHECGRFPAITSLYSGE